MKLSEARKAYYDTSATLSGICRQMSIAGIGIVWVLKPKDSMKLDAWLLFLLLIFSSTLFLDAAQLLWKFWRWDIEVTKSFDKKTSEKDICEESSYEIGSRDYIVEWNDRLFYSKNVFCLAGFIALVAYIIKSIIFC